MDQTINPCEDFYSFSCGGWIKSHPIDNEESSITVDSGPQYKVAQEIRGKQQLI